MVIANAKLSILDFRSCFCISVVHIYRSLVGFSWEVGWVTLEEHDSIEVVVEADAE